MKFVSKRSVRGSYSIHAYHDASVRLEYDDETRKWYVFVPGDMVTNGDPNALILWKERFRNKKSGLKTAQYLLSVLIDRRAKKEAKQPDTSLPLKQANSRMSRSEALEVLGLTNGASKDEIEKKYRDLTKGLHPDRGGSNFLMVQINLARDVLR